MSNPIERHADGTCTWTHRDGDIYVATGILVNGRRFKPICSPHWHYIDGINLYQGTKWLERDGKRYRIKTIWR